MNYHYSFYLSVFTHTYKNHYHMNVFPLYIFCNMVFRNKMGGKITGFVFDFFLNIICSVQLHEKFKCILFIATYKKWKHSLSKNKIR